MHPPFVVIALVSEAVLQAHEDLYCTIVGTVQYKESLQVQKVRLSRD